MADMGIAETVDVIMRGRVQDRGCSGPEGDDGVRVAQRWEDRIEVKAAIADEHTRAQSCAVRTGGRSVHERRRIAAMGDERSEHEARAATRAAASIVSGAKAREELRRTDGFRFFYGRLAE